MAIRLGSARTTPRIRVELQLATGSHRSLVKLYSLNPKTVAKWRARTSVLDEPMGLTDNVLNARGAPPIGNSIAHRSYSADRWMAKGNAQSQRRGSAAW